MRGNCHAAMRGKILEQTPRNTPLIVNFMNLPILPPFPFLIL